MNYSIYVNENKRPSYRYKKYYAEFENGKKVYFGDKRYEQYFDKLGHYSKLNHLDKERRRLYYSRHGKKAKKYSPKWFSHNYLW